MTTLLVCHPEAPRFHQRSAGSRAQHPITRWYPNSLGATMPSCSISASRKPLATGSFISQGQSLPCSLSGGCYGYMSCSCSHHLSSWEPALSPIPSTLSSRSLAFSPPAVTLSSRSLALSTARRGISRAAPNYRGVSGAAVYCFLSLIRTTSVSTWPRSTASSLPSNDQRKFEMRSESKLVSCRPADPSKGCNHRLSMPASRVA